MSPFSKTTRMPFAVSIALIFAYGVLLVAVPPNLTANDEIAVSPETETHTAALDERILRADSDAAEAHRDAPVH